MPPLAGSISKEHKVGDDDEAIEGHFADKLQNIRPDGKCQSAPCDRFLSPPGEVQAFLPTLTSTSPSHDAACFGGASDNPRGLQQPRRSQTPANATMAQTRPQTSQMPKLVTLQDDICGETALKSMFVGAPGHDYD
jgi:hypothetical protein